MTTAQTVRSKEVKQNLSDIFSFTVFPDDLNYAGTLFGGKLLAEMDLAAANTGRKMLYGTDCNGLVTAHLSEVDFIAPANLGDIIRLETEITELGRSSISIVVNVSKEDLRGEINQICKGRFVLVALKDGVASPHGKVIE